jgi:glycosyltransferase involved in cell wall biosynthesis
LAPQEDCDGVQVVRPRVWLRISKAVIAPGMLRWAWKLARGSDVVHLHLPQVDAALIALLSRLLGKPVVLTYHCDLRLPPGPIHWIANRASDLANHIVALSSNVIVQNSRDYAEHSAFLRRYLKKLNPILPPVQLAPVSEDDLAAFRRKYAIQPGQRIIGMAARLATEKGVEYLAEALPQIMEKFPHARVLFVGPYRDVIGEEAYAARLQPKIESLGEHWTFLGVVPDVELSALFHISDVTVLPSLNSTESYGLVQVESMVCGTPVVASDLPGVRVPVTETGMGCLVPTGDTEQLARALIEILNDPQAYRGHPEALIRLSTPTAVAEQYEAIFRSLIS